MKELLQGKFSGHESGGKFVEVVVIHYYRRMKGLVKVAA